MLALGSVRQCDREFWQPARVHTSGAPPADGHAFPHDHAHPCAQFHLSGYTRSFLYTYAHLDTLAQFIYWCNENYEQAGNPKSACFISGCYLPFDDRFAVYGFLKKDCQPPPWDTEHTHLTASSVNRRKKVRPFRAIRVQKSATLVSATAMFAMQRHLTPFAFPLKIIKIRTLIHHEDSLPSG
jgi:hypothetical protein